MSPTKKFSVWLTAIALLVAMVLTPIAAGAKPPASKVWNIYQDKLGAYTVSSAAPKGQTLVAGPYATQATAQAILSTPPTIQNVLTPSAPDGLNGWYVSDVTLNWTITDAPGVLPGVMKVTGGVDQLINADQQEVTYSASATSVGGSAGPVNVAIKRDARQPVLNVGPGIAQGASFEVGSVPAEPTFAPTDATSGVDTSSLTGYGVTIGTHTLTATATDFAGNVATQLIGYTVTPHQATVVDPTKVDQVFSGTPGIAIPGGINVPVVTGIDYFLDGAPAAGFVEMPPGIYQVTASAQTDYELVGYPAGGWTLEVLAADVTVHVSTQAPTATDQTALADGFITIPAVTGVNYLIDGNPASAGDNTLPNGPHLVTAEPQPFYILDGATSWPLTINAYVPPIIEVVPVAPTATDQTSNASGFITIPSVTGVEYAIDNVIAAAGNIDQVPGLHSVTAAALPDYALVAGSQSQWSLTINAYVPPIIQVTPLVPTVQNESAFGTLDGGIVIPSVAGVEYAIGGVSAAAGLNALAPGDYQASASALAGYELANYTGPWQLTVGKDAPPVQVEFVGRAVGAQAGTSVALPAGWQPGDLAVVMVTRNGLSNGTTGTPVSPTIPAGYTGWQTATSGGTGTNQAQSRLVYRVLQAGDTGPSWGTVSFRAAVVLVYRNATPGVALGTGSLTGTSATLPGLTLQNNTGSSWVGGMAWSFGANMRDATPPIGMVNRTIGGGGSAGMGGYDTNGGVTAWTAKTIPTSPTWNAFSFELKVTP